ncbi:TolC family protein [Roseiconus nitratireducens]|uniref:TolC family protein n=2 Tax=Roseiconus nitratireducens TaxID=2605748 RepID=A0A5M6CX97_9BACT|nr:TolC family protein [Roseiconus nitratireducens]
MLVLPACGIPQLQRAKRGPSLPETYNGPAQYFDEPPNMPETYSAPQTYGAPQTSGDDQAAHPSPSGQATTLASYDGSKKSDGGEDAASFANFIEAAGSEEFDQAEAEGLEESVSLDEFDETNGLEIINGATDLEDIDGNESDDIDGATSLATVDPAYEMENFDGSFQWQNSGNIQWCEFFDDPLLIGLINQALVGNQELRILAQEIRIANNEILARKGEYFPFVTAGAGAGLEKSSEFTREGAVEEQLDVAPGRSFPDPLPDFLVAANVTWELDIWRKLRNARDAAALRYLGTREGRNYVVTRLIAEVAENYYELLALDNQLATLDKTIEIQQQSLKIAEAKKEAGRGTELAVQRFQAEVRKNQSEKLIIQQEIVEAENRINFILGRYPQPVARASQDFINLNLRALYAGVPSQLLRNRADIRQAERELAAAGLDVKVARARFYPSLALNAGVGYRAFNTRYLFNSPESLIYNVAGDLVAPLINKKAIRADYLTANAMQLQAVYNYQQTVLNAFTEVINRMAKVENYGQSIEIKKQQLQSLESSVDNATKLFQNARAEYMEVLLAQRDLQEAKMVLIDTKQQQLGAVVTAYQALGGGCN